MVPLGAFKDRIGSVYVRIWPVYGRYNLVQGPCTDPLGSLKDRV